MTNQLTSRQMSLILIVSILANKLLMLPGILHFEAKQDAWIVVMLSFLIDFLFLMIFLFLLQKIKMPLFEYLTKRFGKAVALCFAVPIFLTFALKCVDIFGQSYLFFDQVMYVQVDQIIFMTCFIIIILYLGSRQIRTLGRTTELLFFFFTVSLVLSLYMSIGSVNVENILPIFTTNPNSLFLTVFRHNVWFGDFLIMFLLIGNIKLEKDTIKTTLTSYFVGEFIVLLFVFIFLCVFGRTSSIHRTAIIDITEYTPRLTSEGRLNWAIDLIFPLANVLGLGIYANMGTKALEICLPQKIRNNIISVTIFAGIVFAFALICNISYPGLYQILTQFGCYISAFSQYILPIVLLLITQKKEKVYDKKVAQQ